MKISTKSFCFFILFFTKSTSCTNFINVNSLNVTREDILSTAVSTVIGNVFGKFSSTLNFIFSGSNRNFDDFRKNLLIKSFKILAVTYRQQSVSNLSPRSSKKRFSIIFIDNLTEFLEIYQKISHPNIFWKNGFFLIVSSAGKFDGCEQMFRLLWKIQIFNVNFMHENENGEILVKTFFPFNNKICNDTKTFVINRFENGKFLNALENFFRKKTKNLHKCSIRVSISKNDEPFIFTKELENGRLEVSGLDIKLITTLSEALNFVVKYEYVGDEGYFFENGTSDGPLRELLDGKVELSMSGWWLKENRLKFFDFTTSHYSDQIVFVIPPGRNLNAFEELIYPFSATLWMMIVLCFVVGFTVIILIKRRSKSVQEFVFGSNIKDPAMSFFGAFVGVSQNKIPSKNFARFLLMMFLIYSLIIRTLYQASFFELLKMNAKHGEVQSISEMIEKDFNLYVYHGIVDLVNNTETKKNR